MDNFFAHYTTNPSSSTSSTFISSFSPSSNVNISHQNMDHSQINNNVHFSNNSEQIFHFHTSHAPPYNSSMHAFSSMNQPHQGYSSIPMEQNQVPFILPNTPQILAQREEHRKRIESWRSKIAREERRKIVQRLRSNNSSKTPKETIRRQPSQQERTPHVFFTQDGKRFEEILTKKLRNSDVSNLCRIVLPKREAEEKLPAVTKEGIELVLRDIQSGLEWKVKFKYWINGRTRMYIIENTGNLVKHYNLHMGDYLSLYEDGIKNIYLYTKRACELQTLELFPCADQDNEKEPFELTNEEISSNENLELHEPNQLIGQESNNTTILVDDGNDDADDGDGVGGQESLDEVFESLENIFDIYWRQ